MVSSSQKDWALKLPAIKFGFNQARSDITGYSPFFLNYGSVPSPVLWDSSTDTIPGLRTFVKKLKDALMDAHNAILVKHVKQTRLANQKRCEAPFTVNDLVYLSMENLNLLKERARKLVPKLIGPYRIIKEITLKTSFKLAMPAELGSCNIIPVFHASLLRIHIPNNDQWFPGRSAGQVTGLGDAPVEFHVWKTISHFDSRKFAWLELLWQTGDSTWLPYNSVEHLAALDTYLENMDVEGITSLGKGTGIPPRDIQHTIDAH
jgi:hypothetical protein